MSRKKLFTKAELDVLEESILFGRGRPRPVDVLALIRQMRTLTVLEEQRAADYRKNIDTLQDLREEVYNERDRKAWVTDRARETPDLSDGIAVHRRRVLHDLSSAKVLVADEGPKTAGIVQLLEGLAKSVPGRWG